MNGILGNLFNSGSGGGILGNMNPLTRFGLSMAGAGTGNNVAQNAFRGASVGGGGGNAGNYFQQGGLANAANGLTQGIGGNSRAINILRLLQGEGGIGVLPRLHMG